MPNSEPDIESTCKTGDFCLERCVGRRGHHGGEQKRNSDVLRLIQVSRVW